MGGLRQPTIAFAVSEPSPSEKFLPLSLLFSHLAFVLFLSFG